MPIKLAVVSGSFGDRTVGDTIGFATRSGFQAIELHGKHHSAHQLTTSEISDMRSAASDGITFNLHFNHSAEPSTGDQRIRDEAYSQFLSDLEMLESIGGKVIVLHPGQLDPGCSVDDMGARQNAITRFVGFVATVAQPAADAGVGIAIENQHFLPGEVVRSYSELAEIVDMLDRPNVYIALDIGHCIIGDGLPPALSTLGSRIRHLHLNDAVDGYEHYEVGIGVLDMDEVAPLTTDDYTIPFAAIEAGYYDDDAEGVALRSRDVLRAHFGDRFI